MKERTRLTITVARTLLIRSALSTQVQQLSVQIACRECLSHTTSLEVFTEDLLVKTPTAETLTSVSITRTTYLYLYLCNSTSAV